MAGSMRMAVLGTEPCLPFLAVLSHAHPAPVPGSGVAAGPLAHLEADPTGGAAGRPQGPEGPASVPGERKHWGHWVRLAQSSSRVHPHPATFMYPACGLLGLWAGKGKGTGAIGQDWMCCVTGLSVPVRFCSWLSDFRVQVGPWRVMLKVH